MFKESLQHNPKKYEFFDRGQNLNYVLLGKIYYKEK